MYILPDSQRCDIRDCTEIADVLCEGCNHVFYCKMHALLFHEHGNWSHVPKLWTGGYFTPLPISRRKEHNVDVPKCSCSEPIMKWYDIQVLSLYGAVCKIQYAACEEGLHRVVWLEAYGLVSITSINPNYAFSKTDMHLMFEVCHPRCTIQFPVNVCVCVRERECQCACV